MPPTLRCTTAALGDFGETHGRQMEELFKGKGGRNWQWPAMRVHEGSLEIIEPIRHGSYGNCLMAHNLVVKKAGVDGDFTLHSPRLYVPGIAGQAGLSIEQRRTLGHWGPRSNMPVQYDQARCCTELLMKSNLWDRIAGGFEPAKDFHIPTSTEVQAVADAMHTERKAWTTNTKQQQETGDEEAMIVINHKSMVVHKADPEDPTKSSCQYARVQKPHIEAATEDTTRLTMYIRCLACFGKLEVALPEWKEAAEDTDDSGSELTHAKASSSEGSSATSSS